MKNKPITKDVMKKVFTWFASGNTGVSSKTIATYLCTGEYLGGCTPCDPADFNRCLQLIMAVPELKDHLYKMKKINKQWEKLIDNWDSLEQCFISEVGENWCNGGRATITYNAMKGMGL